MYHGPSASPIPTFSDLGMSSLQMPSLMESFWNFPHHCQSVSINTEATCVGITLELWYTTEKRPTIY